jgi:hypothetical protein
MINSPFFEAKMEVKLQELLNHPAVQGGVAPFLAALVSVELFRRMRLSGLAIIAGFAVTVYLASDFNMVPLQLRWSRWLLPVLGGLAAVWTVQGILQHQDTQVALLWGAGCAAYVAILVWGMDMLSDREALRAGSAATAVGIGTGGAALVGASALLGQFGLALGCAAAAHLLIQMISNKPLPTGRTFTLPLAVIAGLSGCLAVLSAQLPWYALPILAVIPVLARLTPLPNCSVLIRSLLLSILTFALAGAAIFVTWRVAGDVPF